MRTLLLIAMLFMSAQLALANSPRSDNGRGTSASRQASAAEQRGTEQRPLSVVVTSMPKLSDEERAVKAAERREKAESDGWLVKFTAVLAIATVVLAVATAFLWNATRRLVLGAEQTAERQLRAYVSVESSNISGVQSGFAPTARLRVKNFGQTPAYELTGTGGIAIGASFDELPPPIPTQTGQTRSGLPVGATTDQFHVLPAPLTPEMLKLLGEGALTLWVYGEMQYRDAFGRMRTTKYRFQTGGATGVRGDQLAICEEGNEET